ncbi:MAG: lipid droplet-associated protein [Gordonia sp. (in: high G+C Gram-positive bacteria)]|uniref:lipid droplet-associated protein n=1 Tax=Gordonia sp. (in: high G+C Gram-positive bacteria) TaxID=84139 RepID=UPI0039E6897B
MKHRPYSARLAAGLIVTALEETRKLPTQLITMPMTAVSNVVQAGMRMQQNVAELAIKGDAVLDELFDKPEEQPSWAVFDEDEDSADVPARPTPAAAAPTAPAPAKKAPAKKAPAKKAAAKKAPAKKAPAKKAAAKPAAEPHAENPGRFALYSEVPASVETPPPADEPASSGAVPEVVEFLDYENLTLAQLRAKIKTVDVDDLRELAEFERGNRKRTPFLTMLENRIAAKS